MRLFWLSLLSIIIASFLCGSVCGVPVTEPLLRTLRTPGGAYSLEVLGHYYEGGFSGDTRLTLRDGEGRELWSRSPKLDAWPTVSDQGDVAILENGLVSFYGSDGESRGSWPKSGRLTPYYYKWYHTFKHAYSRDGEFYFAFVMFRQHLDRGVEFVAVDRNASEKWRIPLGRYFPTKIQSTDARVVIDDFSLASINYVNRCILMDLSGNILGEYDVDTRRPWTHPIIREEKEELWIYDDEDTLTAYSLEDGTAVRTVSSDEVASLLMDSDYYTVITALSILTDDSASGVLTPDQEERLKALTQAKEFGRENLGIRVAARRLVKVLNDRTTEQVPPSRTTATEETSAFRDYDFKIWGEYNNRVYRFALRFPRNLYCIYEDPPMSPKEMRIRETAGTIHFPDSMKLHTVTFSDFSAPVLYITVYKNPESLAVEEFAIRTILSGGMYRREEIIEVEPLTVEDREAVKLSFVSKAGAARITSPVFIRSHDRVYRFELIRTIKVAEEALSYDELSETILKTLRIYYGPP